MTTFEGTFENTARPRRSLLCCYCDEAMPYEGEEARAKASEWMIAHERACKKNPHVAAAAALRTENATLRELLLRCRDAFGEGGLPRLSRDIDAALKRTGAT